MRWCARCGGSDDGQFPLFVVSALMNGVDGYYQRQARDLVDAMHEKGLLNPAMNRASMDATEDFMAYLFQSTAEQARRLCDLEARMRARKEPQ
jgi:hypothetical protein